MNGFEASQSLCIGGYNGQTSSDWNVLVWVIVIIIIVVVLWAVYNASKQNQYVNNNGGVGAARPRHVVYYNENDSDNYHMGAARTGPVVHYSENNFQNNYHLGAAVPRAPTPRVLRSGLSSTGAYMMQPACSNAFYPILGFSISSAAPFDSSLIMPSNGTMTVTSGAQTLQLTAVNVDGFNNALSDPGSNYFTAANASGPSQFCISNANSASLSYQSYAGSGTSENAVQRNVTVPSNVLRPNQSGYYYVIDKVQQGSLAYASTSVVFAPITQMVVQPNTFAIRVAYVPSLLNAAQASITSAVITFFNQNTVASLPVTINNVAQNTVSSYVTITGQPVAYTSVNVKATLSDGTVLNLAAGIGVSNQLSIPQSSSLDPNVLAIESTRGGLAYTVFVDNIPNSNPSAGAPGVGVIFDDTAFATVTSM